MAQLAEQSTHFIPREEVYRGPVGQGVISVIRFEWGIAGRGGFDERRVLFNDPNSVTPATVIKLEDRIDDLARKGVATLGTARSQNNYQRSDLVEGRAWLRYPDGEIHILVSINEKERREKYKAEFTQTQDHRGYRFWFIETLSSERTPRTDDTEVRYCLQLAGFKRIPKVIKSEWEELSMHYPPVPTESGPKLVSNFLNRKMAGIKTPLGSISERGVRRGIRRINQAEATRALLAFG